jgi:hypothetical protein
VAVGAGTGALLCGGAGAAGQRIDGAAVPVTRMGLLDPERMGRQTALAPEAHQIRRYTPVEVVRRNTLNNIIYIIGLVVVVLAVLAFFGLR